MRILVAAGGTGGHIYPAMAALRPLEQRRPDLEVRWLGGRRGLESGMVPGAGYRLDRLWLRTLRTVDVSVASLLDPVRLAASVPQAIAYMVGWRPDVVYTTGGYVAIPVLIASAALRIPSLLWEGNRLAGRSVRATARLASVIAVTYPDTAVALSSHGYVTGTPIRALDAKDRVAARARLHLPPDVPVLLVFGGSQAVSRFNRAVADALAAVVSRASLVHVTGELGLAEAQANRDRLPKELRERYRPYPFLREDMADALVAADLLVGRAGSSTIAEASAIGLPVIVVPYPHAAGHQEANALDMVAAGAARLIPDEAFDADALVEVAALLSDPARLDQMRIASRGLGRPGAARVTGDLLTALADHQTLPDTDMVERDSKGRRVTEAALVRRLTEEEALRIGTDIQRRLGVKTSRQEPLARFTTMRVGGPADLFAEVRNLFELRAIVRFTRSRDIPLTLIGRGSDLVISDAGIGGLVVKCSPQQYRIENQRLITDSGLPMAKAATIAKDAGLSGLEFGLAIPGTVGGAVWANAGAHDADIAGVLVTAGVIGADGSESLLDATGLGLGYRESVLKAAPDGSPDVVTQVTFELQPEDPAVITARLDAIRRWRQAHQPLGMPSAGSTFRNPEGDSAGRLIELVGLKGAREGGASVSEKHANFLVNDQGGSATDVRRLGDRVRATVQRETGIELRYEIVFAGDWLDWPEQL